MNPKRMPKLGDAEKILGQARHDAYGFRGRRNYALIALLYFTGARISEVLNIQWDDFDFDTGQIYIHALKGSNDHFAIMMPVLTKALRSMMQYDVPVPSNKAGKIALHRTSAHRIVRKIAKKAGVTNFFPHMFRHNLAIRIVRETKSLMLARKALGHKNYQSTLAYAAIYDEDYAADMRALFAGGLTDD